MEQTGHIKIHAENILPIIKKWLYSEKEIFIRELVANAADALTKLNKLALTGEVKGEIPAAEIVVAVDKDKRTVTITDTGLGMTADEIDRYINQVAFSGVQDFVEKYQDKDASQQVIGHFGLGFYSAFMVASKVEIDTLSYKEGARAARWSNDGSTAFSIVASDRTTVGTSVILHISEDSREMLDVQHLTRLLEKYCAFVRYPISIGGTVINEPRPLWTKSPTELKPEDYKAFYHRVFGGGADPLFWVHLNVDYPFNLKGVLFFPKVSEEFGTGQGEVKLFCNQVYVADNVKELIPEFLMLLKGVIDCADLPLNVSRSYLQNDPTVRKIAEFITKKVADKLAGLAKTEKEAYESYWNDIHPFIKFGMMRDDKFYEKLKDHVLFKSSTGAFTTLQDYKERMKDKIEDGQVLYTSNAVQQASYLTMLKNEGIEAVVADTMIDMHFMPFLEMQGTGYRFTRVDNGIVKQLVHDAGPDLVDPSDQKTVSQKLIEIFGKTLGKERLTVKVESLKSETVPALLTVDEHTRRMREFAKLQPLAGFDALLNAEEVLVVNRNSKAVKSLLGLMKSFNREEEVKMAVRQIYDLAALQQGALDADRMHEFIERSALLIAGLGKGGEL